MSENGGPRDAVQAARWDARYGEADGGLFGEAPNDYLRMVMARPRIAPRRALMLADGDGRNGTWLATRGIAVTAVDLSAEATRRAKARDRAAGVRAERVCADLAVWSPPAGPGFDLATVIYLQGPPRIRRRAVETAAAALRPGGWFLLEGFAKLAGPGPSVGPEEPSARYDLEELPDWIDGLSPVEALEGLVRLEEGPRHSGLAAVIRLLARRP